MDVTKGSRSGIMASEHYTQYPRYFPVPSIPSLAPALQAVFTTAAEEAGRSSGLIRRRRKLSGAVLARTLVFGWLNRPHATLEELSQTAALQGVPISPQGLDARFGPASAACLEAVLRAAVAQVIAAQPVALPLLARFRAVTLRDSSTLRLPDDLGAVWRGNGGNGATHTQAALKLQLRWDLLAGTLTGPLLQDGRAQDRSSPFEHDPGEPGSLHLADLGYFALDALARRDRQGAFYLTRLPIQAHLSTPDGRPLDLLRHLPQAGPRVDEPILLGARHRLPCRLLAIRVPQEVADQRRRRLREQARIRGETVSARKLALAGWTILVTNVPADRLSLEEALALARARWQIELLIKLWKTDGALRASRSANPWRILTEVYAKLLAGVVQHWLLLAGAWPFPDRSLVKAAQTVRRFAPVVLLALTAARPAELRAALERLTRTLAAGCRLNRRRTHPNTYQLLQEPTLNYAIAA
jgi:hypothetical protein